MINLSNLHTADIPDDGLHVEGQSDPSIFDLPPGDAQPVSPLHYNLTILHTGDFLHVTGSISAEFEMQCVRSLNQFRQIIELNPYSTEIELEGQSTINLTERLREDIILDLPAYPVCDSAANESPYAPGNALESPVSESGDQEISQSSGLQGALEQWQEMTNKEDRTPPSTDQT